jgi:predicted kinase
MCGLPGTGKDSWIMKCMEGRRPSTEVISLDEIRKELKLKPGDTNGIVIQTAKERAKEYLRQRQSFIWNATNITQSQRRQLVDLFETYKACVRIEYLETTVDEQKRRNHNREAVVPQKNIDEMIGKLQLPEYFEAQYVCWNVV